MLPSIREAVREAMLEQAVTQVELARCTGLQQTHISRYLRGGNVTVTFAERIMAALGLHVH